MKFILDGMLGSLARWLRMMGHDTKYTNSAKDAELLAEAKNEGRVLLTRDFALYQQAVSKNIEAYYVESNTQPERLSEVATRFGLRIQIDLELSRCPKCNTKIVSVQKSEIASEVEKNTLVNYDTFWKCSSCGAVYWQGAHWTKIRETLEKACQKLKEDRI